MTPQPQPDQTQSPWLWALAGLALLAIATALAVAARDSFPLASLPDLISFKTIGLNFDVLKHHVAEHFGLAVAMYIAAYIGLAVLILPGSALFVVASGLLFGAMLGPALASFASTLATTLAFLLARTLVGKRLADLESPAFQKLKAGFQRHALSYMLFLRLTPGPPFALINMGPALIGVPLSTFVTGTFFGLLPSRIALSTAGAGLAHTIDAKNAEYSQCLAQQGPSATPCPYDISMASLLTKETVAAFVALAFLALVPALMDAAPRAWAKVRARDQS